MEEKERDISEYSVKSTDNHRDTEKYNEGWDRIYGKKELNK